MSVLDRFRLDGKVALVTGGTRGLGRAIAEDLASAGASVAVAGRTLENAGPAARAIAERTGSKCVPVSGEISSSAEVEAIIEATANQLGGIDILVNNAGVNVRGPIEELTEADWDLVIDANLKGPWLCARAAGKFMKARGWGRVINLASILAEVSMPGRTPYASSKGGLVMTTKTLALEWAKHGITVNAIAPGPFATEMNKPLLEDPELKASFESKIPLGRWGRLDEIGPLAVFLASEASSFITGSVIVIDGGYTAQ